MNRTWYLYFLGLKITAAGYCSYKMKMCMFLGRKAMTSLDRVLKGRDISLPTKVCLVKTMFFFSSHVWMWELDHKEGWALTNWCFQTVVLEKTLESLGQQEIQPVNPKGNQPWIFVGRTNAQAEALILWLPDLKSWLRKNPDAGKDWRQKEKEMKKIRCIDSITDSMDMNLSKLWEVVEDREDWCASFHGLVKSQTWLSDWTHNIHSTHWKTLDVIRRQWVF